MQCCFRWESEFLPDSIGDQGVEAGTLINLIEMRQWLAGIKFFTGDFIINRWTFRVIQNAFYQIGGGRQILEALLVLNSDCRTTKLVCDPNRSQVHLALLQDLVLGQIVFFVTSETEFHPSIF